MKNLLIFLFGVGCGVGGTLIWLRKDIRKELEAIEKRNNEENMPFEMKKDGKNEEKSEKMTQNLNKYEPSEGVPEALKEENRVQYNKIIDENYGTETVFSDENDDFDDDPGPSEDMSAGIFEIDEDEFMHNHDNEKDRLVYFRGDMVMSTESGTVIQNPFPLVGGDWESYVGNYADRTAFVRNPKLATDYEIYVEDGLYADEFGIEDYEKD